jgi:hypothetical protein
MPIGIAFANPFRYGDLALDDAFTDRERELDELKSDLRNGRNVVVFAPRRFGKSSLVRRATDDLTRAGELVAVQVDLMTAPSKEKLAEKLAGSIYENVATPLERARERATAVFQGLRVTPRITLDPGDGSLGFSFEASREAADIDATVERLLELPGELAAGRNVRAALVFDEFQEVVGLDPRLPALMRAVFQRQPAVARVYLGSKRSMLTSIFSDENEPLWRSAKQIELDVIEPAAFAPFIATRFEGTDRFVDDDVVARILSITGGHPYATQELCYFLWEQAAEGRPAHAAQLDTALEAVLRSEHAHFSRIWDKAARSHRLVLQALARDPDRPISEDYRRRHGLPSDATTRKALRVLADDELVVRSARGYRISEPFLARWVARFES